MPREDTIYPAILLPIDHTPAILKNYRLEFMPGGQWYVEPAMADVRESPGSEVHGIAILLDKKAGK